MDGEAECPHCGYVGDMDEFQEGEETGTCPDCGTSDSLEAFEG